MKGEWDQGPTPPPSPEQQQQQQPPPPPPPQQQQQQPPAPLAPHEEAPAPHEEAPAPDDVPIKEEEVEDSNGYSHQTGYQTSKFRLLWNITLNPPTPPLPRCWVSPPLRAAFCVTRFHAPPSLCHTLLWRMGNWESWKTWNPPPPSLCTCSRRPGNCWHTGKNGESWEMEPPSLCLSTCSLRLGN